MKITSNRTFYGDIESYTISEEEAITKSAHGTVSTWILYAFLIVPFLPIVFLLSPVLYFVTRNKLKAQGNSSKKVKFLKIANKIFLIMFIWIVICLSISLLGTVFSCYIC